MPHNSAHAPILHILKMDIKNRDARYVCGEREGLGAGWGTSNKTPGLCMWKILNGNAMRCAFSENTVTRLVVIYG